jgi:hypothetical protein
MSYLLMKACVAYSVHHVASLLFGCSIHNSTIVKLLSACADRNPEPVYVTPSRSQLAVRCAATQHNETQTNKE